MRSNTTLGGKMIKQIKFIHETAQRWADTLLHWLLLGLSGRQWTASFLIGLLLLPVFSLPVQAAIVSNAKGNVDFGGFEPVNPSPYPWESAWTKLNVAIEEWETKKRPGNENIAAAYSDTHSEDKSVKTAKTDSRNGSGDIKNTEEEPETIEKESAADNEIISEEALKNSPADSKNADENAVETTTGEQEEEAAELNTATEPVTAVPAPRALVNQLPDDERGSVYAYGNNLGSPVGQTEAEAPSRTAALPIRHRAGIANFNFDVPLASLSGRGIDAGVGMTYNSRTWNYSCADYDTGGNCIQNHFTYDVEQSWVAPGFSTGFGYLETQAMVRQVPVPQSTNAHYYTEITPFGIVDSNGTRHEVRCTAYQSIPNSYVSRCTNYKTVDGSHISMDAKYWTTNPNNSQTPYTANYGSTEFIVSYPNGSKIHYSGGFGTADHRRHYPVIIQDRNGNRIFIVYKSDQSGRIDYINDTLNRKIKFYYENDVNGNPDKLVTITIPGMQNEEIETVRFYYQVNNNFAPSTGFSGQVTAPPSIRTLQYVYFPATKTGFKYDYHSFYGMIQKITRRVGMTVSDENTVSSKTATGTVTSAGDWTASTEYDFPSGTTALTNVPKYTKRTDDWRGRTASAPMETLYDVPELPDSSGNRTSTITVADNGFDIVTKSVVGSNGLIKETSVTRTPGTGLNQASQLMTKTKYFWTTGTCSGGCIQVPEPTSTKIETTNDAGLTKATEFEYDSYGNQTKIKEHDYAAPGSLGTLLRTTDIAYETGSGWISANLLDLVKEVKVTAGTTVVSRTLYQYDGNSLTGREMDTPETDGTHDDYYNPARPASCRRICLVEPFIRSCSGQKEEEDDPEGPDYDTEGCRTYYSYGYNPNSVYRGNITKVNRMIDVNAASGMPTNSDESVYTYDITGNVVTATLSCCQLKTFDYSSDTGYAFPVSETKGTSPQLSSSVVYNKYTGLVTSSTDENGITTNYQYEANTLRRKQTNYINGGYTKIEYSDVLEAGNPTNQLIGFVKQTTLLETGKTAVGYTYFDGRGATLRNASQVPGGQWSVSAVEYDKFGRSVKSYNPFYAYSPVGAPPPGTTWTTVAKYDALGRATEVELQDGTKVKTAFSDQVSTPAGFNKTFVTVTDQADKQRRQLMDALGRIIRVDEPDTSTGNLGIGPVNDPEQPTSYEYDGNDNLIKTTQTDGATTQIREFKYDALSRLTHEKQVEATATLDDNGIKQQNGGLWTKVLKYTPKGLLDEVKDARDVKTKFGYDGLNRVKTVVYTGETGYQTPSVTYTYDQPRTGFFNVGALTKVETAAVGDVPATATEFDYDQMGQVKQQRQFIGTQSYNLVYSYNLAGQLISETYPSGKIVSTGYDANGRLATVADQSRTYLSAVGYLGKGNNINSLVLGNGTGQGFAYNDRLQLQTQTLTKPNEILQQYDYGYGQKNAGNVLKNNGKLAQVESHIGSQKQWTQKFDYDAVGRLSEAAEYRGDNDNLSYKEKLDYDKFGNLYRKASANSTSGQQTPLPYTAIEETDINKGDNRFTSATGTTYDDAGNVITDNKFRAMSFGYDANGRMVKATKANTPDAASIYDASGQRVAECVNDVWKFFVYDAGGKMIAEYGGIQSVDEGGVKYPFTDWQGSTRALTSNSGFVQSRQDYTAFGEEVGAGVGQRTAAQGFGAQNNLAQKYAQTERDGATGLDHTWFRKLENRAGRWTSPDPYTGSASIGNPQSFNRYSYVENEPTNFIDPSGLQLIAFIYITCDNREGGGCQYNFHFMHIPDPSEGGGSGGGGGGLQPKAQVSQKCKDIASLAEANTEKGALARLIFAESTGSETLANNLYRSSSSSEIDFDSSYQNERYAVAASVYNRVNYLAGITTRRDPLRLGTPGASVLDVIYSNGDVSGTQYQGFTTKNGNYTISDAIKKRVEKALNSPSDSTECNDLLQAIWFANASYYDPYGNGKTFGLFSGKGSPGKSFYSLASIPGSGNTFYGLNR